MSLKDLEILLIYNFTVLKKKIICTIFITIIPLLSLYSNRVNYESEKAEVPHSAFSLFMVQKDSILKNYNKALDKFNKKEYSKALELSFKVLDISENKKEIIYINYLINKLNLSND